jgi:hypothetical protein
LSDLMLRGGLPSVTPSGDVPPVVEFPWRSGSFLRDALLPFKRFVSA